MIIRWVALGIMTAVMLILFWNFIDGALIYDPLEDLRGKAEKISKADTGTQKGYASAWEDAIYEKNLFDASRTYRPPAPKGAEALPPPKRPELVLRGIVTDSFGELVSYIEKDKAKAVPLRKGDMFEDIEVMDLTEKTVTVKWLDEEIRLSMEKVKTIKR